MKNFLMDRDAASITSQDEQGILENVVSVFETLSVFEVGWMVLSGASVMVCVALGVVIIVSA
jgi:hypothetical protein